jgi:hypothetical protein
MKGLRKLAMDLKWIIVLGICIGAFGQFFYEGKAKAATNIPTVTQFIYNGAGREPVLVTRWTEDGLKCTSIERGVILSLSCVKL